MLALLAQSEPFNPAYLIGMTAIGLVVGVTSGAFACQDNEELMSYSKIIGASTPGKARIVCVILAILGLLLFVSGIALLFFGPQR